MFNQVVLAGNLASEPELKYTPSGVAVVNVRIAVGRNYKNAAGERETDFFTVIAWRHTAEFTANYTRKGSRVLVSGRLQAREFNDREGVKRKVVEVVADEVRLLDRKADADEVREAAAAVADTGAEDPFEDE